MTSDETERKALKFDSGPSTTLAIAQKENSLAATIRYDDEKAIREGDEIDVLSAPTGEKIGVATVEYTETVPVQRALDVVHMRWAEYGITQPDTLVSRLNDYYDDVITRLTEVKVIILDPDLHTQETGTERECLMGHEWCNGPDGETESGVAFGGLCGECHIERSREAATEDDSQ